MTLENIQESEVVEIIFKYNLFTDSILIALVILFCEYSVIIIDFADLLKLVMSIYNYSIYLPVHHRHHKVHHKGYPQNLN